MQAPPGAELAARFDSTGVPRGGSQLVESFVWLFPEDEREDQGIKRK